MTASAAPLAHVDLRAEEDLVRTNLPLVGYLVSETCRRLPRHVQRSDLESAGMAALAHAARDFQPERGVPFGRYATLRIRGALLDELRSVDWASRSVRARARQHEQAAERLAVRLGRSASSEELAAELGVSAGEIESNQHDVHRAVVLSFQAVLDTEGGESVLPSREPAPEAVLLQREREAYLVDAVAVLPERLRAVVVGTYFEERPLGEVAAELGITESRVSQMRTEALGLLRDGLNAHLAPDQCRAEERPDGRVARRKQSYYAAIAARSDYRARLSLPTPRTPMQSRVGA